jgi:hypothetical protein
MRTVVRSGPAGLDGGGHTVYEAARSARVVNRLSAAPPNVTIIRSRAPNCGRRCPPVPTLTAAREEAAGSHPARASHSKTDLGASRLTRNATWYPEQRSAIWVMARMQQRDALMYSLARTTHGTPSLPAAEAMGHTSRRTMPPLLPPQLRSPDTRLGGSSAGHARGECQLGDAGRVVGFSVRPAVARGRERPSRSPRWMTCDRPFARPASTAPPCHRACAGGEEAP